MTPDQNAIARTCWGEMRSGEYDGMAAVASVIMNRAKAKTWWGITPYEVCHKPYQFSCWLSNDPNLPKLLSVTTDDPDFAKACEIAEDCTQPNWVDTANGAMWYYSGDDTPHWAIGKIPCLTIGNTRYYNDIN